MAGLESISGSLVKHHLSEVKKQIYDGNREGAIALIDKLTELVDDSKYHCERCNKGLSEGDYRMAGELCESCCLTLGCHSDSD